jgi:hypothetical protein
LLQFEYNGEKVSSSTTIPGRPTNFQASANSITVPAPGTRPAFDSMQPLKYTWDNPNSDYQLLVLTCIQPNPVAISDSATGRQGLFHTPPTQGSSQTVTFGSFSYYGQYRVVLYRIWSAYAALYDNTSGNSSDLTAPPGNITNGYGIFTGINTSADTLYVTVQ